MTKQEMQARIDGFNETAKALSGQHSRWVMVRDEAQEAMEGISKQKAELLQREIKLRQEFAAQVQS